MKKPSDAKASFADLQTGHLSAIAGRSRLCVGRDRSHNASLPQAVGRSIVSTDPPPAFRCPFVAEPVTGALQPSSSQKSTTRFEVRGTNNVSCSKFLPVFGGARSRSMASRTRWHEWR